MNEKISTVIIVFLLGLAAGFGGGFLIYNTGISVADVRARADLAESENKRLESKYNDATNELHAIAERLQRDTDRLRRNTERLNKTTGGFYNISDALADGNKNSLSIIREIREVNGKIQAEFLDCCRCERGSDSVWSEPE